VQPSFEPCREARSRLEARVVVALLALGAVLVLAGPEAPEAQAAHLGGVLVRALPNTKPLAEKLRAGLAEDLCCHGLHHGHVGVHVRLEEGDDLAKECVQRVKPPLFLHAGVVVVHAPVVSQEDLPGHRQGPQQQWPDNVEYSLVNWDVKVDVMVQRDLVRDDVFRQVNVPLSGQHLAPLEGYPVPVLP